MAPKMTTVRALALIFGINPDWLIGKSSDKFHIAEEPTPQPTVPDPRAAEFAELFSKLSPEQQDLVLAALRGMKGRND